MVFLAQGLSLQLSRERSSVRAWEKCLYFCLFRSSFFLSSLIVIFLSFCLFVIFVFLSSDVQIDTKKNSRVRQAKRSLFKRNRPQAGMTTSMNQARSGFGVRRGLDLRLTRLSLKKLPFIFFENRTQDAWH
jgi:hypothetical protein